LAGLRRSASVSFAFDSKLCFDSKLRVGWVYVHNIA
jgi:hypothetical protein